jgi:hypothetical protein
MQAFLYRFNISIIGYRYFRISIDLLFLISQ